MADLSWNYGKQSRLPLATAGAVAFGREEIVMAMDIVLVAIAVCG